jgi:hypothetical protein
VAVPAVANLGNKYASFVVQVPLVAGFHLRMLFSWLQIVGTCKIAFVASWLKVLARSLYSGFGCCCAKGQQPLWAMGFVGLEA